MSPEGRAARRVAAEIVERLARAGHEAYFAGGCVRDELLGLEPKDYDVATDATPDRVGALFRRTREVGKAFGVMHVYEKGYTVEVATFRAEGGYSDKRRPDHVTFSDARADAARRDFTINALFIDPLDDSEGRMGRVIDYVGGRADLEARLVRAVGDPDERLAEDHLRALRAVRFTARLGFHLEEATAAAVTRHASELVGVSRERIGDECRAMLGHPRREAAVSLMQALGLDGPVLGEACVGHGEIRAVLSLPHEASFAFALAGWAVDRLAARLGRAASWEEVAGASGELVSRWRDALCLTNEERAEFRDILCGVGDVGLHWGEWGVARRKRASSSRWFEAAVHLLGVDDSETAASIRRGVRELAGDGIGLAPPALVTGDDLITAGLTPGPMFGKWLDAVYDLQLEGEVRDRGEALERVVGWAGGVGGAGGAGGAGR